MGVSVKVPFLIIGFLLLIGAFFALREMKSRIQVIEDTAQKSRPFEMVNGKAKSRVLVLGDSTAVGTGVKDPRESVVGLLWQEFPHTHIINLGRNYLRAGDLAKQLSKIEGYYTLVIIFIGGNDIIRFTSLEKLTKDISFILERATHMGEMVVLVTPANVGVAPLFPKIIGWVYQYRSKQVYREISKIARGRGVLLVDIPVDPFLQNPERFYADDLIHPSSEGYRIWYEALRRTLAEGNVQLFK